MATRCAEPDKASRRSPSARMKPGSSPPTSPGKCSYGMWQSAKLVRPALRGHTGIVLGAWFAGIDRIESVSTTELAVWGLGERATLGSTIPAGPISVDRHGTRGVALTGPNGTVHLLDTRTGRETGSVATSVDAYDAVMSPDGRRVALAERPGVEPQLDTPVRVLVWSLRTRRKLADLRTNSPPNDAQFSPDGRSLAVAEARGEVELLSAASGRAIAPPLRATQRGGAFAVASRQTGVGSRPADSMGTRACGTRELADESAPSGPHTSRRSMTSAFDPTGDLVAVASEDGQLVLADARQGHALGGPLVLTGTTAWASVAFSGDGRLLAASTFDGAVVVWDVARRLPLGTALGNQEATSGLAFTDDDDVLVSGAVDSTGLRRLRPQSWERQACAIAGRNLTRREWQQFLGDRDYHETCPRDRPATLFGSTDPAAFRSDPRL